MLFYISHEHADTFIPVQTKIIDRINKQQKVYLKNLKRSITSKFLVTVTANWGLVSVYHKGIRIAIQIN